MVGCRNTRPHSESMGGNNRKAMFPRHSFSISVASLSLMVLDGPFEGFFLIKKLLQNEY